MSTIPTASFRRITAPHDSWIVWPIDAANPPGAEGAETCCAMQPAIAAGIVTERIADNIPGSKCRPFFWSLSDSTFRPRCNRVPIVRAVDFSSVAILSNDMPLK